MILCFSLHTDRGFWLAEPNVNKKTLTLKQKSGCWRERGGHTASTIYMPRATPDGTMMVKDDTAKHNPTETFKNEETVDADDEHVETDQVLLEIPSFLRRQSK